MKDIQLLREIGEIDEKFAEEALTRKSRPPVRVRIARWGAVAACLALTVAIGIIVPRVIRSGGGPIEDDPSGVVTDVATTPVSDRTDPVPDDTPAPDWSEWTKPDDNKKEPDLPEGVGGVPPQPLDRYLDPRFERITFGPGGPEVFTSDESERLSAVLEFIDNFDAARKLDNYDYHNCVLLWSLVHELGITREEFVKYNDVLKGQEEEYDSYGEMAFTDAEIDAIMQDDLTYILSVARSEYTIFNEETNEIIRLPDVAAMTNEQFREYGFDDDRLDAFIESIGSYYNDIISDIRETIKTLPEEDAGEPEEYGTSVRDVYLKDIRYLEGKIEKLTELVNYRAGRIDDSTLGVEFLTGEKLLETERQPTHEPDEPGPEIYSMPEGAFVLNYVTVFDASYPTPLYMCKQAVEYGNMLLDVLKYEAECDGAENVYDGYKLVRVTLDTYLLDDADDDYHLIVYDYEDPSGGSGRVLHFAADTGGYCSWAWFD